MSRPLETNSLACLVGIFGTDADDPNIDELQPGRGDLCQCFERHQMAIARFNRIE